ncbi:MAG: hypothetical protein QME52_06885 [Bacteroidota bacterium]|nr:hypothetical protein [Bacteroidota bacterium]
MTRYIFLFAVLFCLSNWSFADERASLHLTGITSVDFLGSPKFSSSIINNMTVDFNESKKNKKSPWIACLLSTAVPGAGEFYSESYVKAGIFFGIDVGSLITAIIYNKKGNRQTDIFENYAHEHYSPIRYAQWVLANFPNPNNYDIWNGIPDPNAGPPYSSLNWDKLNRLEEEIGRSTEGFTHRLPYFPEQQYYELIGKYKQFSKGWDSQIGDDSDYRLGNKQFYEYGEMFNEADKYYTIAGAFVSVMIANHIISALDAAWSAARYNKALHAEVSLKAQATPGGYTPLVQANITYSF